MASALIIAVVISAIISLAALFAEGRAQHFIRVLTHPNRNRRREHMFADVSREGTDWGVVERLEWTSPAARKSKARERAAAAAANQPPSIRPAARRERTPEPAQRLEADAPAPVVRTS